MITKRSHHLRLDTALVEAALRDHLTEEFGRDLTMKPVNSAGVDLGAEVRLLEAGHHIVDLDLFSIYGPSVVAGVTAQLLGRGCSAVVAFDAHLSTAVREACAAEIVEELDSFDVPPQDLEDRGWRRTPTGRWELLLLQP